MIIAFLESIKYLGQVWPVAILRVFIGWFFLSAGIEKVNQHFLDSNILVEILNKWIERGGIGQGYLHFLQTWVIPHHKVFAIALTAGEIAVGVSFIIGFMVRPMAVVAIFLSLNFIWAGVTDALTLNKILIVINITLFLISAGRAVGFDYYFFKRVRGIWW